MAADEKAYNGFLFDRLETIERVEKILKESADIDAALKELEYERTLVERKLYQDPKIYK